MPLSTEQATRLILASAVRDAIGEAVDEIRDEVRAELRAGDRVTGAVGDTKVGAVQITEPKASLSVVDWSELMAWVMEHVPAAIVTTTTVNKAWVSSLIRDGGTWTDPQTGEVVEVPGLGTTSPQPRLMVTQTDAAGSWAQRALGAAMLQLQSDQVLAAMLEAGEPDAGREE